jgi:putative transposase
MIDQPIHCPSSGNVSSSGGSLDGVLPTPVSAAVLTLMRRIDELHLDHPFAGARMLRDLLRREGHSIGRRHVSTLMRRMGITAVYRMPRTSQRHPAHRIYPYLLRR